MKNIIRNTILLSIAVILLSCNNSDNDKNMNNKSSSVKIAGAMRNVMHKGELFGTINLDTINNKTHLYGLGPVEYLTGELLIADGRSFLSRAAEDGSIAMEETFKVKAPFFVYANIDKWKEIILPDSIQTIQQLETYLDLTTKKRERPFAFQVKAAVDSADIHIASLPKGTEIHSPEDDHQNQIKYTLKDENVLLIGFFSTEHQGVFTHHDSFVHIHLITQDKKKMGHLDNMILKRRTAKLYLPEENS
jgi:acetolactate decarboxylase